MGALQSIMHKSAFLSNIVHLYQIIRLKGVDMHFKACHISVAILSNT